jgi:hypothetical protein
VLPQPHNSSATTPLSDAKAASTVFRTAKELAHSGINQEQFDREWQRLVRTPAKDFIEVFCDPDKRFLPVHVSAAGAVNFITKTELEIKDLDINKLIQDISPQRISEGLLKKLGVPFSTKDKEIVVDETLVKQLLAIFSFLQPVPGTDGRACIITAGEPLLARLGIKGESITGSLLFFRHDRSWTTSKVRSNRKIVMFFPDVAAAFRKTLHQTVGENREATLIPPLSAEAQLLAHILTNWSNLGESGKGALHDRAETLAHDAILTLGKARLEMKIRAANLVGTSVEVSDRTGRPNPRGTQIKYAWAAQHLDKRRKELTRIGEHNRGDQLSLLVINYIHDVFFQNAYQRILPFVEKSRQGGAAASMRGTVHGFLADLGLSDRELQTIITKPHLTFREAVENLSGRLIESGLNNENSRDIIRKIAMMLKLSDLQRLTNLAKIDLIRGRSGVDDCAENLRKMAGQLREMTKTVFGEEPEIKFRITHNRLTAAIEQCQALKSGDADTDGIASRNDPELRKLKRMLDEINFERAVARKLAQRS